MIVFPFFLRCVCHQLLNKYNGFSLGVSSKPLFTHLDLIAEIWLFLKMYFMGTFLECGRKDNRTSWNMAARYAQGVT